MQHVDRIERDPLIVDGKFYENRSLIARYRSIEHPDIGGQERNGSATYVYISDPHDDEDCPFGMGPVIEVSEPN